MQIQKPLELVGFVLLASILVCTAIFEYNTFNAQSPAPTIPATSFDRACTFSPEPKCNSGELTEVLEFRAEENPMYVSYSDSEIGISFNYPSAIAHVRKENKVIYVEPIVPAPVYTEYWNGTSISVIDCNQTCPIDLSKYLNQTYNTSSLDSYELTVASSSYAIGTHTWVQAGLTGPMGDTHTLYVTVAKNRLITVSTDVVFGAYYGLIDKAFYKILQTLQF